MLNRFIRNAILTAALCSATSAFASTYTFSQLLGNSNADVGSQLLVDVTDTGTGVNFQFTNTVGTSSSITAVYFQDVANALFTSISNNVLGVNGESAGVNFSDGATPPNLPQGNTIGFSATASGDAANPSIPNGVDATGEYVNFLGALALGGNYNAVIQALDAGQFRIAISVQSTNGRGADRYISNLSAVPVPGAVWLFGSAIAGLAGMRRRKL
jgi:hypothetical protein